MDIRRTKAQVTKMMSQRGLRGKSIWVPKRTRESHCDNMVCGPCYEMDRLSQRNSRNDDRDGAGISSHGDLNQLVITLLFQIPEDEIPAPSRKKKRSAVGAVARI